jgi:hypothetical protein
VHVIATSLVEPALEASAQVVMIASRPLFVAAAPFAVGFEPSLPRVELTTSASVVVAPSASFAVAAPVALRVAPAILSVTPSTGSRGELIRVVVTGAGFDGATGLEFELASGRDARLAVSDFSVSADGSEASANVAIAPEAVAGARVVRIVTPAGTSGDAVPGENVFVVQ